MFEKKAVQVQIEDLLLRSYTRGAEWQKGEDNTILEEEVIDAYEKGHDKGYDKGYAAGLKDGGDK